MAALPGTVPVPAAAGARRQAAAALGLPPPRPRGLPPGRPGRRSPGAGSEGARHRQSPTVELPAARLREDRVAPGAAAAQPAPEWRAPAGRKRASCARE